MSYFYQELLNEKTKILKELGVIRKKEENSLGGHLRVSSTHKKYPSYFWVQEKEDAEDTVSRYLRRTELDIARNLAMKAYLGELDEELAERLNLINRLLKHYQSEVLSDFYEKKVPGRKELIDPLFISDAEFVKAWESEKYETNPMPFDEKSNFYSEKGERVRSRVEKLIADNLFYNNIPYRYECAYVTASGKVMYPDFTCLNVRERKVYIWEHFGKMGDKGYVEDMVRKNLEYHLNGELLGITLIYTFEYEGRMLDTRIIDKNIKVFLI